MLQELINIPWFTLITLALKLGSAILVFSFFIAMSLSLVVSSISAATIKVKEHKNG